MIKTKTCTECSKPFTVVVKTNEAKEPKVCLNCIIALGKKIEDSL